MKLKGVEKNIDRHGNVRIYVRLNGKRLGRIHADEKDTAAFLAEYQALLNATPVAPKIERATNGSLTWLCQQYYGSSDFKQLDPITRKRRRAILERICKAIGSGPYKQLEARHVRKLRDGRAATPDAANGDVKALRMVYVWAIEEEHADKNPTLGIRKLRPKNQGGFKVWSEAEIEAYEARHPIGTKARLAMDLLLYTGVRRSDVHRLGPQMERAGELHFTEFKGRNKKPKARVIPILPDLRKSIDATVPLGLLAYLVNEWGKPFTVAGFGNKMRQWCDEAGLKGRSAHGLRKAGATRCADRGATVHQLMALYGWMTLEQAEVYTREADRRKLSREGVQFLQKENKAATLSTDS